MQTLAPRIKLTTRSTGTVHTSAKARLTSVAIRIAHTDRHQHWIICSFAHCQPSTKFHVNPFGRFCAKLLTDGQTDKQRRLHNLLVILANQRVIHRTRSLRQDEACDVITVSSLLNSSSSSSAPVVRVKFFFWKPKPEMGPTRTNRVCTLRAWQVGLLVFFRQPL